MTLSPEQRNAAIEAMWGAVSYDAESQAEEMADVGRALDALLEAFVVLPRDDVTEEREARIVDATGDGDWTWDDDLPENPTRDMCEALVADVNSGRAPVDDDVPLPMSVEQRTILTTRWQPITDTKEQTDGR